MSEPRYQIGKFADSGRQWTSGTVSELDTLREQLARAQKELDRIREETGMVRHKTHDECAAAKCGCVMLTAEEAVAALRHERDQACSLVDELGRLSKERIADLKRLNVALAERVAGLVEIVAKRAERGGV